MGTSGAFVALVVGARGRGPEPDPVLPVLGGRASVGWSVGVDVLPRAGCSGAVSLLGSSTDGPVSVRGEEKKLWTSVTVLKAWS